MARDLMDKNFHNFEQVVVNLDNNGNVLTMRDAEFWEGTQTINGGSGVDVINIAAAGTYDLTGVDWDTIDILKVDGHEVSGQVAVKIDEEINISKFMTDENQSNVDKIIGVGNDAALYINMTRQEFATSLKKGTNSLTKVAAGDDTLTFKEQSFELKNIRTLTFSDDKNIFLDSRNNAAIRVTTGSIDAGSGNEDQQQVFNDSNIINHYYDIEQKNLRLNVTSISDSKNFSNYGSTTTFNPNDDYYGNSQIQYKVSDGKSSIEGSANYTINGVNDAPVITGFVNTGGKAGGGGIGWVTIKFYDVDSNADNTTFSAEIHRSHTTYHGGRVHSRNSVEILGESTSGNSGELYIEIRGEDRHEKHGRKRGRHYVDDFYITITDEDNASRKYLFDASYSDGSGHRYHNAAPIVVNSFKLAPIILDLDGDGFEATQGYSFDYDSDGDLESGTWLAGASDAVLAIDYDGDGKVTHGHEIAFAEWHPDAATDLEGLQLAFDTNRDGILNADDEKWSAFGVWQDCNSNGVSDEGEFLNMEAMGIVAFHLESDGIEQSGEGYHIFGEGQFEYADGSFGKFADAAIAYNDLSDEAEQNSASEEAAAVPRADTVEDSVNQDEQNAFADEDDMILAQMLQVEQWHQQSAGAALSDSESALFSVQQDILENIESEI